MKVGGAGEENTTCCAVFYCHPCHPVTLVTVSVVERSPVRTVANEILRLRYAPLRMTIKRAWLE